MRAADGNPTLPDITAGAIMSNDKTSNGNGLAELEKRLWAVRHAKLAVGAASTLAVFLFETHKETK